MSHEELGSMIHVDEQPSPDTVLLSSQASIFALKPSPQVLEQIDFSPEQVYP